MYTAIPATALRPLIILITLKNQIEALPGLDPSMIRKMAGGNFLGMAYASSIGGTASKIGTAPNLVLVKVYEILFPTAPPIGFATWFGFGLPTSLIMMAFVWSVIVYRDMPPASDNGFTIPYASLKQKYSDLGPMLREEKTIAVCFFTLAALWFFRVDLGEMTGWTEAIFDEPDFVRDGTTAIFMAVILFSLPAHDKSLYPVGEVPPGRPFNSRMLCWNEAKKVPWDMVLLFGGGM
jgi:sodium-dependent dicarboxylate transporter 2/3/5